MFVLVEVPSDRVLVVEAFTAGIRGGSVVAQDSDLSALAAKAMGAAVRRVVDARQAACAAAAGPPDALPGPKTRELTAEQIADALALAGIEAAMGDGEGEKD